jgi:nucleotidyltransferase substrate binding protein (TIGR01987 family)
MEILEIKKTAAKKSLAQLKRIIIKLQLKINTEDYEDLRNSLIHTFEFTFDTFWKYLKEYLREKSKIELAAPTPNRAFRTCYEQKLITEEEFDVLANATSDRNATFHTYEEDIAIKISERVKKYYEVMQKIVDRL